MDPIANFKFIFICGSFKHFVTSLMRNISMDAFSKQKSSESSDKRSYSIYLWFDINNFVDSWSNRDKTSNNNEHPNICNGIWWNGLCELAYVHKSPTINSLRKKTTRKITSPTGFFLAMFVFVYFNPPINIFGWLWAWGWIHKPTIWTHTNRFDSSII